MRRLCQTLKVHPSGYYAWLAEPKSVRAKEDQRLLGLIKHAWLESGGVYGYRKIHYDQGSQFSSSDWQSFLKANNLISSMSRRGNCHDNAVAESFFQLLKRERIRRKTYGTREEARSDVFDYTEMFYNPNAGTAALCSYRQ